MNEFFTWSALGTYAGATVLTAIVTEFFKGIPWIKQVPTRIFAYIVAAGVLIAATAVAGALNWETAGLAICNAFVVATAASGGYDAIKKQLAKHDDSGEQGDLE